MVGMGWNVLHACLVSEPSYSPSYANLLGAVYENLLNFEMSPKVRHVERVDDIFAAKKNGQLGIIFGVQNSSWIEQERERLRILHKLGLRSLQLTYMERNWVGDGCLEPENRGLTNFGMQVVRECNRLGSLVDCSHVGHPDDAGRGEVFDKPIVISHTAVRAITENPRCVTDEQMKAVADKGGTDRHHHLFALHPHRAPAHARRLPRPLRLRDRPDRRGPRDLRHRLVRRQDQGQLGDPWYYPEVTQGKKYDGLGLVGFKQRSELAKWSTDSSSANIRRSGSRSSSAATSSAY
jgi:hypothetical protein